MTRWKTRTTRPTEDQTEVGKIGGGEGLCLPLGTGEPAMEDGPSSVRLFHENDWLFEVTR